MNSASDNGGENAVAIGPAVLLAVFVGLGVIIFTFLLKWIRQEHSEKGNAKDEKPEKVKGSSSAASGKHSKKEQAGAVKSSSKKKLTERENRRSARANEKGFNHPWLLATLKGHSGRVLDMDFSANGKYLVSCGDEDPDPGGTPHPVRRKSPSSTCNSSASSSEGNNSQGLTRRQRKNRKRETTIMPVDNKAEQDLRKSPRIKASKKGSSAQPKNSESSSGKMQRRKEMRRRIEAYHNVNHVVLNVEPLEEYGRMKISKNMFVKLLKQHYILTPESMGMLGYPLRPEFHLYYNNNLILKKEHRLDVYAEEFIPRNDSGDSGNGSSSSSEEEGSSGSEGSEGQRRSKLATVPTAPVKRKDLSIKTCARCGSFFYTTSTQYITLDRCLYHPGRIKTSNGDYGPMSHSCCGQPNGSLGCNSAPLHVWSGPRDRIVSSSFVETEPPKLFRPDNDYGVYSLDCEMSYTVSGLEVVKITMVDIRGFPIYNEYVKPLTEIVDFNTQFSGIVADDFIKNPTKTLAQVQKDLKKLICSETVLIGHGLENDLRALKLIHKTVVDTAFTFPHYKGLPLRRSLKNLAKFCLKKEIQVGDHGHDSFEDARACMELMLLRIRMDFPTNSDRTVFIWEVRDLANKDRKSLRVNIEFDYATHVKWSPDCKAFVIHKYNENCLEVYKVDKKKDGWLTANKSATFPKAHETDVIGMGIASNGKFIMTCSNKTDMVIWDLKGEKLAKQDTFLMNTTCAKISPCGRFVVASGFTPEAKTWEVIFDKSGEFKEVKQVPQLTLGGHTSGVYDVAFDVDSSHMATVSKDGTWRLFDTNVNYKQGQDARLDRSGTYELAGSCSLVALSPNAEVLVVASASDLQFFSTLTGQLDYTIENISDEHISNLLFDASGKYLLVSSDKQIRVFHNVTGYRCSIAHAKEKLKEHQTSATRERLQQIIKDSEEFLKNFV